MAARRAREGRGGVKPEDIVIWHPIWLSGVPRRVVINAIGRTFASVSVVAGDPNPNGNRSYTARIEELRRIEARAA